MDFGDILDKWDSWEGFEDKDLPEETELESKNKSAEIDARIDLHGMTKAEAQSALDDFFKTSRQKGYRKVLVIHGKGNHSAGGGVLYKWIKTYLERCPYAGKSGYAKRDNGGRGATWVMIKK